VLGFAYDDDDNDDTEEDEDWVGAGNNGNARIYYAVRALPIGLSERMLLQRNPLSFRTGRCPNGAKEKGDGSLYLWNIHNHAWSIE